MDELPKKPKDEQNTFLGMPMNWSYEGQHPLKKMWNPDDDRLFPPKSFGIGWTINLHAVGRRLGLIQSKK